MDQRFLGKTIVITGAGGNFGKEGCFYFLRRGANVAAVDLNKSTLDALHTEAQTWLASNATTSSEASSSSSSLPAPQCITFQCDVTNAEQVRQVVDDIEQAFPSGIDLLWNNAGYQGQILPTLEYDPADFATVMNINVTGMFIVLQAVAKKLVARGRGGAMVNTASVAGLRGTPAMVAYSASKAAVLAMTVTTAKDLAPHSIRVNAVSPALIGPGYMWTRQNELHAQSQSPYFSRDPNQVAQAKIDSVPLKRLGTVEEVLQSVAFLLSDESSYCTATNLVVDGGLSGGLKA